MIIIWVWVLLIPKLTMAFLVSLYLVKVLNVKNDSKIIIVSFVKLF